MKKTISLLLVLLMLFTLCSCKNAGGSFDGITLDVIISQYGPNTQEWFLGNGMNGTSFKAEFEKANPDIRLNLEVVSWNDLYTVVDTRTANNQAPDILNIDVFANYANEGLLMPASEYCPSELFDDFFPTFAEQSEIDGTCWAIPAIASARAMFYNKDILDEVGVDVPTTWSELRDACDEILDFYDGKIYPWGVDMTNDEGQAAFAYYTFANGGGFIDEDGNWALNSSENVEAIEYAIDLVKDGYTNPNPETQNRYDLQDMFSAGKLAMLIAPNQLPTYVSDKGGKVNIATAQIPSNDGKNSASFGVMDRLMAFKDESAPDSAKRTEAISRFLKFFYAPENYIGWLSMEGFLPVLESSVDALAGQDESYKVWLDVLGDCKFQPTAMAEWDTVKQGVITVEQKALTGASIKDELDKLQQSVSK